MPTVGSENCVSAPRHVQDRRRSWNRDARRREEAVGEAAVDIAEQDAGVDVNTLDRLPIEQER